MTPWNGADHDHDPREPRADAPQPRTYVTQVWCPPVDDGVHSLHSRMKEPQSEPEPEAGS
jgi:hypothetical protein